ncbi:unnamed protein product [Polarella glacialis]|uniref:Uncharacterized protein n=1 Tax=Polarella glacialis TaxID=89957 RepID=A0A813HVL8_POLGL|nr:unnamed protein product [Polarella glacialis]
MSKVNGNYLRWRLVLDDEVDTRLEEMEAEMRSGKESWLTGSKHKHMQVLEAKMKDLNFKLQDELMDLLEKAQDVLDGTCSDERKLANMTNDDPWAILGGSELVIHRISNSNFKLQIMAWGLSHTMSRKRSVLRKLEKLRRSETLLARQALTEKVLMSSEETAIAAELERLNHHSGLINQQAAATKDTIAHSMCLADVLRGDLRKLKFVVTVESLAKRDELLKKLDEVVQEDMRLAWLRKSQLQMLELCHMLDRRLAIAPPIASHIDRPQIAYSSFWQLSHPSVS